MPNTPSPFEVARQGRVGTPIVQAIRGHRQQISAQAAQAQQSGVYDQWMNTVSLSGSNLNQVVTIGALWKCAGVEVGTLLGTASAPVAGIAKQQNLVTATYTYAGANQVFEVTAGISTTRGSIAATLDSSLASAWAGTTGYTIGALDVTDLTAPPAITPGTYIHAISGTSVTLSQAAAETGTGLYCAACEFVLL